MKPANPERVVIEDLVKFGEDRGYKRGLKDGRREGRLQVQLEWRSYLRRVLALRQLVLSPENERRIDTCTNLAKLRRWFDQAVLATSAAEALK